MTEAEKWQDVVATFKQELELQHNLIPIESPIVVWNVFSLINKYGLVLKCSHIWHTFNIPSSGRTDSDSNLNIYSRCLKCGEER
jgi:hypothetical protein